MNDEAAAIEMAKRRCRAVMVAIESLPTSTNITVSCKRTLLRLAHSELSFLSRLSSSDPNHNAPPSSLSINIGHLEAILHILQQPFIHGVSRVCKSIPMSPALRNGCKTESCLKSIHIDIVCTLKGSPVWFIVSDRNPKYISWLESCGNKGLQTRIKQVLDAAQSSLLSRPSSVILFFSNGLSDYVRAKLEDDYGAFNLGMDFSDFAFFSLEELESEWVDINMRSYQQACILEIKLQCSNHAIPRMDSDVEKFSLAATNQRPLEEELDLKLGSSFCSLVSSLNLWSSDVKDAESDQQEHLLVETDLLNFDTTALIAIVSGISNGTADKLLATSESELKRRFKGNTEFVMAQVISETQNSMHVELECKISGKRGIICESVFSEFKELVSMCGGANEKLRGDQLLNCLKVVPDNPSARMMRLPTTRKLAMKNKVVFGTGDYWQAPTLTANMAFVRAVSQTGMSLFTMEHRPRALTGD